MFFMHTVAAGGGAFAPGGTFQGAAFWGGENMEFWKLAVSGELKFASQNGLVRSYAAAHDVDV